MNNEEKKVNGEDANKPKNTLCQLTLAYMDGSGNVAAVVSDCGGSKLPVRSKSLATCHIVTTSTFRISSESFRQKLEELVASLKEKKENDLNNKRGKNELPLEPSHIKAIDNFIEDAAQFCQALSDAEKVQPKEPEVTLHRAKGGFMKLADKALAAAL